MLVPLRARPQAFVMVETDRWTVKMASYPDSRSAQPIVWVEADTHVAQAEKNFHLAMDAAALHGHVTDGAGKPMAGVVLMLANTTGWYRGGRGHQTFPEKTVTDDSGAYRIDNIPSQAGYEMKYKDGKVKGNCDADLVLNVMTRFDEFEKAVIVSGDGDFYCLVKHLKDHEKLRMILVPDEQNFSALLKPFASGFLSGINVQKRKLEYVKNTP